MKTPKRFTDNLKNRVITKEMLGVALYSVNKRAKKGSVFEFAETRLYT